MSRLAEMSLACQDPNVSQNYVYKLLVYPAPFRAAVDVFVWKATSCALTAHLSQKISWTDSKLIVKYAVFHVFFFLSALNGASCKRRLK
jgi:hypothetical protein